MEPECSRMSLIINVLHIPICRVTGRLARKVQRPTQDQ